MAHPPKKAHGTPGRRGPVLAIEQTPANISRMESPVFKARVAAKMTQAELATASGLAQTSVSRVERMGADYNGTPIGTARALAAALGTTVDALFPPKGGTQ